MDEHTSHELAYKKGYEQGKQDAQKWIPVTERLPEERKSVLVLLSSKLSVVARSVGGEWYVSWNNALCRNVTHWMPLPEPPKGE